MRRLRFLTLISLVVGLAICNIVPRQVISASARQKLTPQNINNIKEISRLSGPSPSGLIWSPNGYSLAVSTSADIRLYDTRNIGLAPIVIPSQGRERLIFSRTGDRVINAGQVWDAATGQLMPPGWYGDVSASGKVGVSTDDTTVRVCPNGL